MGPQKPSRKWAEGVSGLQATKIGDSIIQRYINASELNRPAARGHSMIMRALHGLYALNSPEVEVHLYLGSLCSWVTEVLHHNDASTHAHWQNCNLHKIALCAATQDTCCNNIPWLHD